MLSKIELMNKRRARKHNLQRMEMNKRVDRLTMTRRGTLSKYDNRIALLTKKSGCDGHGKYKSDYYIISNIDQDDIDDIMNPESHSCDYDPEYCHHNKYKATDMIELYSTEHVDTNWGLRFKTDFEPDSPIGLGGGTFRMEQRGDKNLQHIVFFDADDVDYETLYNCSDPDNPVKAKKTDKFVLDFGTNGGLIKYVNSTCAANRANVELYRFINNGQWQVEYWTKRKVKGGDIVLANYEMSEDLKGKKMNKKQRFKDCKCYKFGIKECVNSPRHRNKGNSKFKQRKKNKKIKNKLKMTVRNSQTMKIKLK